MNSLFDFITYVKGTEYVIAIMFIAGYILYWEILKPKPFQGMVKAGREDLGYLRETGRGIFRTAGKVVAAPFVGLVYVVALPFVFFYTLATALVHGLFNVIGKEASFGWRPTEAYLSGKKKDRGNKKEDEKES